jgi:hypothetical protein
LDFLAIAAGFAGVAFAASGVAGASLLASGCAASGFTAPFGAWPQAADAIAKATRKNIVFMCRSLSVTRMPQEYR